VKENNGIVDYGREQTLMGDEEWWPVEGQPFWMAFRTGSDKFVKGRGLY
jgi:hypothetical protein